MRSLIVFLSIVCVVSASASKIPVQNGRVGLHTTIPTEFTPKQMLLKRLKNLSTLTPPERVRKFEDMASNFASVMRQSDVLETETVRVSAHIIEMSRASSSVDIPQYTTADTQGNKIRIPINKIHQEMVTMSRSPLQRITVILAWWKKIHDLPVAKSAIIPVNSSAVTISYFLGNTHKELVKYSLPVEYYVDLRRDFTAIDFLKEYEKLQNVERECAWLNLETNDWETSGCAAKVTTGGVYCDCNHTTTFVTLLLVNTSTTMPPVIYKIALALQILSIVFLFLTIVFIAVARHGTGIDSSSCAWEVTGMNKNRTNSQISLCVSLMLMHLWSVIGGWMRSQSDGGCVAMTLLTHYFLLASAHWSLCEGLGIFAKMYSFLTMKIEYRIMTGIQIFVGWCVPLIITVITAAYGIQSDRLLDKSCRGDGEVTNTCEGLRYTKYDSCWLSKETGMIWAAIGPLVVVLLCNIAIFIYITVTVVSMKRKQPQVEFERSGTAGVASSGLSTCEGTPSQSGNGVQPATELSTTIQGYFGRRYTLEHSAIAKKRFGYIVSITRSFGILMPILGVPWIVGILANIEGAGVALTATHSVVNGLQGFLLFLLYCVSSKRDLKIVKRKWRNSAARRFLDGRKYKRRESVISASALKRKVKHDNNNTLHPNRGSDVPTTQYDTLSSHRSNDSTVRSSQSLQNGDKTTERSLQTKEK